MYIVCERCSDKGTGSTAYGQLPSSASKRKTHRYLSLPEEIGIHPSSVSTYYGYLDPNMNGTNMFIPDLPSLKSTMGSTAPVIL
jgi:hypothetical protein